ncbi:MAG: four helix bundle protein [Crocinitomicaceae bacterium]|nr:four helix bundle protein [Crocinitomicaceae bacterium]MBK8927058.1 four helix bundle protein [Crocinitomicaceae bacterium]
MGYVTSYRELEVYKHARRLAQEIFETTKSFPTEEKYSLTDQVRRSSRSIGAQIAESWAKRKYPKHFISKLTDADGEQHETQHWIDTALDCKYISEQKAVYLKKEYDLLGKRLGVMMEKSAVFCKNSSTEKKPNKIVSRKFAGELEMVDN